MVKLLLDHGLARSAAARLTEMGFDVKHVADIGLGTADDVSILDFARSENRICCTLDADFHRHLAANRLSSPSTIRIRIEGLKGREAAELVARLVEMVEMDLNAGAAVSVTRNAVRVRHLPLTVKDPADNK